MESRAKISVLQVFHNCTKALASSLTVPTETLTFHNLNYFLTTLDLQILFDRHTSCWG